MRTTFDNQGREVLRVYVGENGQPVMQPEGYAGVRKKYDAQDRLTLYATLDEALRPVADKDGVSQIRYEYSETGMMWVFLDATSALVNCP